jgi:hypothetical protein
MRTEISSDFWATPRPSQSEHAAPAVFPAPPQAGQTVENFMKPRWTKLRPLPPHDGQDFRPPPEAEPCPRQDGQLTSLFKRMRVWTPLMASSKPMFIV